MCHKNGRPWLLGSFRSWASSVSRTGTVCPLEDSEEQAVGAAVLRQGRQIDIRRLKHACKGGRRRAAKRTSGSWLSALPPAAHVGPEPHPCASSVPAP
jgi:hypothetical protein